LSSSSNQSGAKRTTTTRHGRLKKHGPLGNILRILAVSLAVIVVAAGSVSAIAVFDLANAVNHKVGVHLQTLPGQKPPTVGSVSGAVNMLLVGTDTRSGQGGAYNSASELAGSSGIGNNDVTILIHIAANHQSAMVVSFPRDTVVSIPACPASNGGTYPAESAIMLNGTLVRGGLSCPVLTIEHMTGVSIPYAGQISFDGVAAMSDAVGGVNVCVATKIEDSNVGLHLSAGEHTLVGAEALAYLRSRHGIDDGSDLGRISSQEIFLSSLVRKIEAGGVLSNPIQLYSLATAAVNHMTLSESLEHVDTLVAIAEALKGIPLSHVVMMQYPTESDPANPNRVIPLVAGDLAVNAALQSNEAVKLSGTTGRGSIAEGKAGKSTSTSSPSPTGTTSDKYITLPASVTGQNADQETCAKGNG
jgi:LCP family protein required for cell wall assembly